MLKSQKIELKKKDIRFDSKTSFNDSGNQPSAEGMQLVDPDFADENLILNKGCKKGYEDTHFISDEGYIFWLLPSMQEQDLSKPFSLSSGLHPSFGVVEIIQIREGVYRMLVGNNR